MRLGLGWSFIYIYIYINSRKVKVFIVTKSELITKKKKKNFMVWNLVTQNLGHLLL